MLSEYAGLKASSVTCIEAVWKSRTVAAGTWQSTTLSWLLWMFIFENYADQLLDRRRRLIGMRLGTRFFIYGMNGSGVLLQIPAPKHGLTSHAKIIRIWQGMLPLYLRIGGFNVFSLGVFWVLDVRAVHDIRGNQNFKRIAVTRILGLREKLLWMKWCGTHITKSAILNRKVQFLHRIFHTSIK